VFVRWVVTIAREDVALGMCPYVGAAHRPRKLRADLENMIELERDGMWEDPECEVRAWLDKLADVDRQRFRAQDMSIQVLLNYDELREKLTNGLKKRVRQPSTNWQS
jgi:hypothetical protein